MIYGIEMYRSILYLLVSTPLENMSSSIGTMTFPIDGKIIQMFQTTNQILYLDVFGSNLDLSGESIEHLLKAMVILDETGL